MYEDPIARVCPPCTGGCKDGQQCPGDRPTVPMTGPAEIPATNRPRVLPRRQFVGKRALVWALLLLTLGFWLGVGVLWMGLP